MIQLTGEINSNIRMLSNALKYGEESHILVLTKYIKLSMYDYISLMRKVPNYVVWKVDFLEKVISYLYQLNNVVLKTCDELGDELEKLKNESTDSQS